MVRTLQEPFSPRAVKTKPGSNHKYIEGETIIRRLNRATGCRWSTDITSQDWRELTIGGKKVVCHIVCLNLTIPDLGTRCGFGVQEIYDNAGGDVAAKGAHTDALKNAAVKFGIGIELYGPDLDADRPSNNPHSAPTQAPAANGDGATYRAEANEQKFGPDDCVECGKGLTPSQITLSTRKFNVQLCPACQNKRQTAGARA